MNMRRLILVALVALLAVGCGKPPGGSTAGSSAPAAVGGLKRLIFINNGDDPFWHACNAGLLEGAKRYALESRGLRVVMETNNGTAQGQIEKLRQLAKIGRAHV